MGKIRILYAKIKIFLQIIQLDAMLKTKEVGRVKWIHSWNKTTTADKVDVWPYHVHNKCEIVLILQGATKMRIRDQEYVLSENQLVIIPPLEPHAFEHIRFPYRRIGMNVDCGALGAYGIPTNLVAGLSKRNQNGVCILDTNQNQTLSSTIADIYEEYAQGATMQQEMIAVLLHQFLLRLYRAMPDHFVGSVKDTQMEQIRLLMETQASNCPSVKQLAEASFLTESHFIVRFKNYTGYTPCQYRILCQVSMARQLLTEGELSLQEIADTCGFGDLNSFVRRFRQVTKTTPAKFRQITKETAF